MTSSYFTSGWEYAESFFVFNFERKLPVINCNEAQIDDLLGVYENIFLRLKQEQEASNMSALSYDAIIRLTYRVTYKLTMKQDNVQKKVGDVRVEKY